MRHPTRAEMRHWQSTAKELGLDTAHPEAFADFREALRILEWAHDLPRTPLRRFRRQLAIAGALSSGNLANAFEHCPQIIGALQLQKSHEIPQLGQS